MSMLAICVAVEKVSEARMGIEENWRSLSGGPSSDDERVFASERVNECYGEGRGDLSETCQRPCRYASAIGHAQDATFRCS
jgi:hypothetical protein